MRLIGGVKSQAHPPLRTSGRPAWASLRASSCSSWGTSRQPGSPRCLTGRCGRSWGTFSCLPAPGWLQQRTTRKTQRKYNRLVNTHHSHKNRSVRSAVLLNLACLMTTLWYCRVFLVSCSLNCPLLYPRSLSKGKKKRPLLKVMQDL